MGDNMKAVKLNKKLWAETVLEEIDASILACTRPLLQSCGIGCSGGCCCTHLCVILIT